MYVHYVLVQYAAVYAIIVGCVCVCVCVPGGARAHTHTHTIDDNGIRPVQEHNERTSTEFNSVTAQSTAHEPAEDGRKYGPKHLGASFLKCS
jgi:hypothetical protein